MKKQAGFPHLVPRIPINCRILPDVVRLFSTSITIHRTVDKKRVLVHNLDAAKSPIPRSAQAVNDSVDNPVNRPTRHYFHMHLISDATGETLNTVARAAAAHYADYQPLEHIYALVRTPRQLQRVLREIERQPGIVLFTIVDQPLRAELEEHCARLSIPCISILDPVIASLASYLNAVSRPQIGRQHALTAEYFRRIDALNFTMLHDDGQNVAEIEKAEVVLIGISRTSKTPTSIYLANRGVKTANVPIVPGIPLPPELTAATHPLIIGLVASAERIAQIRRHRLLTLKEHRETAYVDRMAITEELVYMRKVCTARNWPIIDVTRRSIEETAAAILNLMADRTNTEETTGP